MTENGSRHPESGVIRISECFTFEWFTVFNL